MAVKIVSKGRSPKILGLCTAYLSLAVAGTAAQAQVTFSTGVQEIYDDNIFLEDELDTPLVITVLPEDGSPPEGAVITKDEDGDPNDDLLTNVYLRASGRVPLSSKVRTALDTQVGAIIFANEDSENRLTVDALASAVTEKSFLRDPFSISLSDHLQSGQSNITNSQGAGARQAETNDATLLFDARDIVLTGATKLSAGYSLNRHDFLGEFLFKSNTDDERREIEGSDFFNNRITSQISHDFSSTWEAFLDNNVEYLTFTKSRSNFDELSNSDLNRINYHPALGVNYTPSERLRFNAQAGLDYSYFVDDPAPRTRGILNDDGTITAVTATPESDQTTLFYGSGLSYAVTAATVLNLTALQSAGTDLDGQRLTVRSFAINASHLLYERVALVLAGQFSQYNVTDSLSNSTDRFDTTAAVRIALTDAIVLQVGYNYTNQNADEQTIISTPSGRGSDYEANRAFISLDTGFVLTR